MSIRNGIFLFMSLALVLGARVSFCAQGEGYLNGIARSFGEGLANVVVRNGRINSFVETSEGVISETGNVAEAAVEIIRTANTCLRVGTVLLVVRQSLIVADQITPSQGTLLLTGAGVYGARNYPVMQAAIGAAGLTAFGAQNVSRETFIRVGRGMLPIAEEAARGFGRGFGEEMTRQAVERATRSCTIL